MPTPAKANTRTRLIQAAVDLAYRQGFGSTTLADIAKAAKVPPGNVYYYYKTKEEIAEAIVEQRLSELAAVQAELAKIKSPRERLCKLVLLWLENREAVAQYGCPIGTFCSESRKDGGVAPKKASAIFDGLLDWVEAQFGEFCPRNEARGNAVHLVSVLEGVTVLANCAKGADLLEMESARLLRWIRSV